MAKTNCVFVLRTSCEDSREAAEKFCQALKKTLLELAPKHGITAEVEYTVSEKSETCNCEPSGLAGRIHNVKCPVHSGPFRGT